MTKTQKILNDSEKIKSILQNIKIDLAVDLERVKSKTKFKEKIDNKWNQFYAEEKLALTHPIFEQIRQKQMKADHGTYFSKFNYTVDEENFLKSNPHTQKMDKLIEEIEQIENNEKQKLKQRLKNNTARIDEKKQLEKVEFTIWDSSKKLLNEEEGNDLPAFSVDSDFYNIFNDNDGEYSFISTKTDCQLRQQLNELGYDYESYDGTYKIIYPTDKKITKINFLNQNTYCKKYIKEPKTKNKGK